jgi:hypothetical protein
VSARELHGLCVQSRAEQSGAERSRAEQFRAPVSFAAPSLKRGRGEKSKTISRLEVPHSHRAGLLLT